MNERNWMIFLAPMLFLVMTLDGVSQDFSRHFISIKSGMINFVEGKPRIVSAENSVGKTAMARDQLKPGDQLLTRESDRVELLLNPGSYLRIFGKARLEIGNTDFDQMRYALREGKAILESITFNKKLHSLWIATSAGQLQLLGDGLYRIETENDGPVHVMVYAGKMGLLRDGKPVATLKKGNRYALNGNIPEKLLAAKFNTKEMDAFDLWSKERDGFLMTANTQIPAWMRGTVYSYYGSGFGGGWVYNPLFGAYTFLPYSYYLRSPYGFRYFNYDPIFYYPVIYSRGGYSDNNSGGGFRPSAGTVEARSSAYSSPSAPAARVESGRSEVSSRSDARGR